MPELPEVESFKQYLEDTTLGKEISGVDLRNDRMLIDTSRQALVETLKGNKFEGFHRHGKFLFIRLAKGGHLVVHFGLTGNFERVEKGEKEPRYTSMLIKFRNGSMLSFTDRRRMGKAGIVADINTFVRNRGYGPDALQIEKDEFIERFKGRRTNIKTALMNQKLMAGVGNEYSDEILFQAGLHPESRVDKLSRKLLEKIWKQMQRVLKKAVSVNADHSRLTDYFFLDNRKAGLKCPGCKGKTQLKTIGGRSSYFCPSCQELIT